MSENIKVAIRFRPGKEDLPLRINTSQNTIELSETNKDFHLFAFDHIFSPSTEQLHIFNTLAKDAINLVCQGYNATVFAYGATSSGKSFTMFGTPSNPGLIPRCCDLLFQTVNHKEDTVEANMKCSFIEIYRERIRDLLAPSSLSATEELKIRHSPLKGPYVQGLIEKYVYSSQDILATIREGSTLRTTASTSLNSISSRSHAVLTLIVSQKTTDGTEITSKLNLVDLAGSENVGKSEVQGIELAEAQTINRSLSCLGNVIYALTEKGREHIPYRDSKLTYLLQDSLGGNSKTILIATCSPTRLSYYETLSTLKFAKRAKDIKNIPKVNKNESTANLLKTIETLQARITELETNQHKPDEKTEIGEKYTIPSEIQTLLTQRAERLERKIAYLETERDKDLEQLTKLKELFEQQRSLAKRLSEDLYSERSKLSSLSTELEQLRLFYNSVQETVGHPDVLLMLIARSKIAT